MTTRVKYIGTAERFFEIGITGQQDVWLRGESGDVSDQNAALLVASGQFEYIGKAACANGVVLLGDSITANNTQNTSSNKFTYDKGYFTWLNKLSGQRFNILNNAGVAGERTDQMVPRLSSTVGAYNPGMVFVMAGTNDVVISSYSTIVANLQTIYEYVLGINARCLAITIPPNSTYTTAQRALIQKVNRWIAGYCRTTAGMIFGDVYSALIDPTSATAAPLASAMYDGTHPSNYGAYLMGKALNAQLAGVLPPSSILPMSSVADNYGFDSSNPNILDTGLFQGSGGTAGTGASGTVATGWTLQADQGAGTVVGAVNAGASGFGNSQDMTITSTANGESFTLASATMASRFSLGQSFFVECEVRVSGATNLRNVQLVGLCSTSGAGVFTAMDGTSDSSGSTFGTSENWSGVLRTPLMTVPPSAGGVNSVFARVSSFFNGAGGATVKVERAKFVVS